MASKVNASIWNSDVANFVAVLSKAAELLVDYETSFASTDCSVVKWTMSSKVHKAKAPIRAEAKG